MTKYEICFLDHGGRADFVARGKRWDVRLKLEGTHRQDRHGAKRQPAPAKGVPASPAPLDGEALAEWTRMVELLRRSELLTVVDGAMLYNYCELRGDAVAMRAHPDSSSNRAYIVPK